MNEAENVVNSLQLFQTMDLDWVKFDSDSGKDDKRNTKNILRVFASFILEAALRNAI
jgi:hypothetical protein